jgi:amino acid transporter
VSLGQGFGLAGTSFILPLAVVVVLNSFIALSFAELHAIMPDINGGVGQYTLVGLGPWASIVSNISAYLITMIFATSVELSMCGIVLHDLIPQIPAVAFSIAVIIALFTVNMFGVDIFAKVQNVTVILLIGSMACLGIIAALGLGAGTLIPPEAQSAPAIQGTANVMSLAAVAFWLFIGVEFIIPAAKDLKKPRRDVLLSMILALIVLFVVQAVLGTGMTRYVSLDVLSAADMPHIIFAENLLGNAGRIWMGIITLLAGVTSLNTVLPSTGRILQGMAEENMVPKIFRKLNAKNVPWVGMLLLIAVDMVLIATGYVNSSGLINMILAGSCFWLASYILTHLTVLVLRRRYPDAPRYKRFTLLGIPQIVGIVGNVYMIWNISSDMESRISIFKVFGVLFVVLAVYAYIWVRFILKTEAFKPVGIETINNPAPTVLNR